MQGWDAGRWDSACKASSLEITQTHGAHSFRASRGQMPGLKLQDHMNAKLAGDLEGWRLVWQTALGSGLAFCRSCRCSACHRTLACTQPEAQWVGRLSDFGHGAQRAPSLCSAHRTLGPPGQRPPKGPWPPPAWPPSSALPGEPSADGQKRPAQILPEGETQVGGI